MGNFLSACYIKKNHISFRLFQTIWPLLHPTKTGFQVLNKTNKFLEFDLQLQSEEKR